MSMATLWPLRCSQETETMTQQPPADREELATAGARAYSVPDVTVLYDRRTSVCMTHRPTFLGMV
jgi:hypothetical protein